MENRKNPGNSESPKGIEASQKSVEAYTQELLKCLKKDTNGMDDYQKASEIFGYAQKIFTHLIINLESYPLIYEEDNKRDAKTIDELLPKHQKELQELFNKYKNNPDLFLNAPRYHQMSVEDHTKKIFENMRKYESTINQQLHISLDTYFSPDEINLLKTYGMYLHDVAKLYPIFLVQECKDLDRNKEGKCITNKAERVWNCSIRTWN